MNPSTNLKNILLIEDDAVDVMMFTELFGEIAEDIQIHSVGNGLEALKFLQREPPYSEVPKPQIMILDLNMPTMGGLEFLNEVKVLAQHKGIPVLIFSTSDRAKDIRDSYDGHASGYIIKPSNYADYADVLETVRKYWANIVTLNEREDTD